jgi:gliding motility-associated-like protein
MKNCFLLSIASTFFCFTGVMAQLKITNSQPYNNANYLVEKLLGGKGGKVSNVTYSGSPIQIGYFNGKNTNVGLDSGIIISSGSVFDAAGPNTGMFASTSLDTIAKYDSDMAMLAGTDSMYDPAILEFDFVAGSNSIHLNYVFGSEEYMELANEKNNDAFGILLSGPGISGTFSNSAVNLALIPNSNLPVSIANVNAKTNAAYYRSIGIDPSTTLQYNGVTVALCTKATVTCGERYHLKIIIADARDSKYDSGLFLNTATLSSGDMLVSSFSNTSLADNNKSIDFKNKSVGATSWDWDFGDGNTSALENPTHIYGYAGTYPVTLVTHHLCKTDTARSVVYINDTIAYPTVFTPNGDGQNDEYYFPNSGIKNFHVEIYDRWGKSVYISDEGNNKWNGTNFDGKPLPIGTYYYAINGVLPTKSNKNIGLSKKGYITIL